MKVEIIAKIITDIEVIPDCVINSDTISEYKNELDCNIGNSSLDYLSDKLKDFEEIHVLSIKPSYDDEEYDNLLNSYQKEYDQMLEKIVQKHDLKLIDTE